MEKEFDVRFPSLAGGRLDDAWSAHLCLSKNAVSMTRQFVPGRSAACMQNGLGTARSTLAVSFGAEGDRRGSGTHGDLNGHHEWAVAVG